MPAKSPKVLVSNVMTSQVRTAEPGQRLPEIWQMLMDERCHHIPVIDGGVPVGMLSARDLVAVARKQEAGARTSDLYESSSAKDVMSTDLQTVRTDDSVDVAIDRIGRGDIHALIVLDDADRLAGIVTHHDLLHYLID